MLWTEVTPCSATYFIAAASARSRIASEGGGHDAVDQAHRVVLEQARRLAARRRGRSRRRRCSSVARVTPAAFSAALLASAMWPSSRLTQTGWFGVAASIHPRVRQLAAPQAVVPVAAGDPGAGRHGRRKCLDAADELLARLRIAQLHRRQPEAAVEEVHVRVDEARDDQPPRRIHRRHARRALTDLVAGADGDDLLAIDGDRFGPGPGRRRPSRRGR